MRERSLTQIIGIALACCAIISCVLGTTRVLRDRVASAAADADAIAANSIGLADEHAKRINDLRRYFASELGAHQELNAIYKSVLTDDNFYNFYLLNDNDELFLRRWKMRIVILDQELIACLQDCDNWFGSKDLPDIDGRRIASRFAELADLYEDNGDHDNVSRLRRYAEILSSFLDYVRTLDKMPSNTWYDNFAKAWFFGTN